MDLLRPANQHEPNRLAEQYASNEATVLKEDFINSLCASYRIEEVEEQLVRAHLENLSSEMSQFLSTCLIMASSSNMARFLLPARPPYFYVRLMVMNTAIQGTTNGEVCDEP